MEGNKSIRLLDQFWISALSFRPFPVSFVAELSRGPVHAPEPKNCGSASHDNESPSAQGCQKITHDTVFGSAASAVYTLFVYPYVCAFVQHGIAGVESLFALPDEGRWLYRNNTALTVQILEGGPSSEKIQITFLASGGIF